MCVVEFLLCNSWFRLGRPHQLSGPCVLSGKTLIGNFGLQCLELMVSTAYLVGGRHSVFDMLWYRNEWILWVQRKNVCEVDMGCWPQSPKNKDVQPAWPSHKNWSWSSHKTIIPSMFKNNIEIMCSSKLSKSLLNPEKVQGLTIKHNKTFDQIRSQTSHDCPWWKVTLSPNPLSHNFRRHSTSLHPPDLNSGVADLVLV